MFNPKSHTNPKKLLYLHRNLSSIICEMGFPVLAFIFLSLLFIFKILDKEDYELIKQILHPKKFWEELKNQLKKDLETQI